MGIKIFNKSNTSREITYPAITVNSKKGTILLNKAFREAASLKIGSMVVFGKDEGLGGVYIGRTAEDASAFVLKQYAGTRTTLISSAPVAAMLKDSLNLPKEIFRLKIITDNPKLENGCTFYKLTTLN